MAVEMIGGPRLYESLLAPEKMSATRRPYLSPIWPNQCAADGRHQEADREDVPYADVADSAGGDKLGQVARKPFSFPASLRLASR